VRTVRIKTILKVVALMTLNRSTQCHRDMYPSSITFSEAVSYCKALRENAQKIGVEKLNTLRQKRLFYST